MCFVCAQWTVRLAGTLAKSWQHSRDLQVVMWIVQGVRIEINYNNYNYYYFFITIIIIVITYYIFCCRNRNWDSPDLMQF